MSESTQFATRRSYEPGLERLAEDIVIKDLGVVGGCYKTVEEVGQGGMEGLVGL
jgi:hypothetical protein